MSAFIEESTDFFILPQMNSLLFISKSDYNFPNSFNGCWPRAFFSVNFYKRNAKENLLHLQYVLGSKQITSGKSTIYRVWKMRLLKYHSSAE